MEFYNFFSKYMNCMIELMIDIGRKIIAKSINPYINSTLSI